VSDLGAFTNEMRRLDHKLQGDLARVIGTVVSDTYDHVLRLSDPFVRSGSYRSRHHIIQDPSTLSGNEPTGEMLFQAAQTADPDVSTTERNKYERPDPTMARASVRARLTDVRPVAIVNDMFYAFWLENGTARMRAKQVYAQAALASNSRPLPELGA
jgi:hypothetical protein